MNQSSYSDWLASLNWLDRMAHQMPQAETKPLPSGAGYDQLDALARMVNNPAYPERQVAFGALGDWAQKTLFLKQKKKAKPN